MLYARTVRLISVPALPKPLVRKNPWFQWRLIVPKGCSTGAEHRSSLLGHTASRGTPVTSDESLVDRDEVLRLERQGVIAIDVETAAIAVVCEHRQCP